ncbi:MAG: glycoside hydrolase family 30 protein [Alkalispirochaeta sp.]
MKTQVFRTSRDENERLTPVSFHARRSERIQTDPDVEIRLDPSVRYQQVRGFGGAITEAAAYTLSRLPEAARNEVIGACFDAEVGNRYTMSRLHINSCDFSLENYDYVADGDRSLESFDISREERWVLPVVRQARETAGGQLFLLAAPWSPPGWMKTNGEMNHGGSLLPEFRPTWAAYLVKYLQAMRAHGVTVSALSAQNEPAATQTWDSCVYSAPEEREFVKKHLGPTLHENDLGDVKLLIWDHNRDIMVERVRGVLSDPEAAQYVWGVGHHWYQGEEFENLSLVHDAFPDTHLIFTEGCQEGGVHLGSWFTGERYGRNIIGDMRNWVEGWTDWNIVLDETGGPNHVGNYCDAPIIADTKSGELHYNSSYWYIGHFSRFVSPGSTRIDSRSAGSYVEGVSHVAFETPEGSIVTVVMNESDRDYTLRVKPTGTQEDLSMVSIEIPAHGIITAIFPES